MLRNIGTEGWRYRRLLWSSRFSQRCMCKSEHRADANDNQQEPGTTQRDDPKLCENVEAKSPFVQRLMRVGHAAEISAVKYFEGQSWATGSRIDVQYFLDQEQKQLRKLERLAADSRLRPSPLLPVLEASSWALGVATAIAPKRISLAVAGAVQESLSEEFNNQIRELRDADLLDKAPGLREVLRGLRDTPRAPHGAPRPPDLSMLNRLEDFSPVVAVGAAVFATCRTAMNIVAKT